ncbi:GlcG/HbpS family heme-binding protein [Pseudomonas citri]|uniref:GlcG/HbpS family heme-binding protein n=1 Tax=Pseudomonas citri TaxID=2978349 RepID=UPI0021B5F5E3|nr:heme-binding protein [Pseudomonas citri]
MSRLFDLNASQALIAEATRMAGKEYNRPISVAVCDANGLLVAFAREPDAPIRTIAIAQGKAYTAARMGVETSSFHERLQREQLRPDDFCDAGLTALPGGAHICDATGKTVGAIGISGLTAAQDQIIATAVARQWGQRQPA